MLSLCRGPWIQAAGQPLSITVGLTLSFLGKVYQHPEAQFTSLKHEA